MQEDCLEFKANLTQAKHYNPDNHPHHYHHIHTPLSGLSLWGQQFAVPASCSHHWPGRAVSRGEPTEDLWLRVTLGPLSVISETDLKRVVSGEEEPASIPKDPITLQPHLPCDDLQGASMSPLWWPKANTMSVARIPSIGCGA